jgi:3',5'-cyclic AMP phosphodiesterase CpdA
VLNVLHVSDLQCGRPFLPVAADALVRFAHDLGPDAIVVAGDLTQRAKPGEFLAAKALLGRLPTVPLLVTPGNHDVPLYRVWERARAPYRNWRAFVTPELDSTMRVAGATFVALNSSAPHSAIVAGRIRADQLELARLAFESASPDEARVLVTHHHFIPAQDGKGGRPLPGAALLLAAFESMGVDLVLGGHLHQTQVRTSGELLPGGDGPGIPLIACGTTVRVTQEKVEVRPHLLRPGGRDFEPVDAIVIRRNRVPRGGREEVVRRR